ncbi:MAG: NHL repeat-containing protein [Myxococcaceae bacterium]
MLRFAIGAVLLAMLAACGPSPGSWQEGQTFPVVVVEPDPRFPRAIASDVKSPTAVAVGGGLVYWVSDIAGEVRAVQLEGGTPTLVASGQLKPRSIAADASAVYWTNMGAGTVMKAPHGGAPSVFLSGQFQPYGLFLDADKVYWTELAINGSANRIAKSGDTATKLRFASNESSPEGIVAAAGVPFWANYNGDSIRKYVQGTGVTTIASSQTDVALMATDGSMLVWASTPIFGDTAFVASMPANSNVPSQVAGGRGSISGLAFDGSNVYWTEPYKGIVARAPIGGGPVETLASGQSYPRGVAVNGNSIYWANEGSDSAIPPVPGSIMRRQK